MLSDGTQTHLAQSMYPHLQVFTILGRAHEHLSLKERRHLSKEWHLNSVAVSQTEIWCGKTEESWRPFFSLPLQHVKILQVNRMFSPVLTGMHLFPSHFWCKNICLSSSMVPVQPHLLSDTSLPSLIARVVSVVVCLCFPYNLDFCSKLHSEEKMKIETGFGGCVCV